MANASTGLEPRIAAVEALVGSLAGDIKSVSDDVRSLTVAWREKSDDTDRQLRAMAAAIADAKAPKSVNWQVLLTAAVVLMSVAAAVLFPINNSIAALSGTQLRIADRLTEHERATMHPVGEERLKALDTAVHIELENLRQRFEDVLRNGSPITRERLGALEMQMRRLEETRKP